MSRKKSLLAMGFTLTTSFAVDGVGQTTSDNETSVAEPPGEPARGATPKATESAAESTESAPTTNPAQAAPPAPAEEPAPRLPLTSPPGTDVAVTLPTVQTPTSAATVVNEQKGQSGPVGPAPLEGAPTAVKGKWNPTLYGYVELDMIHDSTQSYSGVSPGFVPIARPESYAGQYGRTIFDARGSRFGFRLATPEVNHIKATALIEADFLGNQPATQYPAGTTGISEYSFSTSPVLRIRHAAMKVETPIVDVLAGQYWQLFGWQPYFFPLTVQIPSYPGEPYSRSPQLRVSRKFASETVSLEVAAAAARPPARNTDYPDGQAGLRLLVLPWKGVLATGFSGPYEQSAGVGVSGVYRRFSVPEFAQSPTRRNNQIGKGFSIDALLPLIPGTVNDRADSLTITGSFSSGTGISDLYTPGSPGNVGFPSLPNPTGANPAPAYPQDIDNGLVTYDPQGQLHTIDWQMYIVGAQYYLPPSGNVWLSANYGHASSDNVASFGVLPTRIIPKYSFWDAVAFVEVTQPVVVGLEYAQLRQTYADGTNVKNSRVALATYFIFY